VWEPAINESVADAMLQVLHLPTRQRILETSMPSDSQEEHIRVQLDGNSCYDQMPLDPRVRGFFTFLFRGILHALTCLPMGFRAAVEVASAILWALLDFERPTTVSAVSHIDNVRFAGPKTATMAAIRTFVKRARACNYQLDHNPITEEEIMNLATNIDTFLGIRFHYNEKLRSLPPKTQIKLNLVASMPRTPTQLQLASAVGVLTWAGAILNFPWHRGWHFLRKYASCAIAWKPKALITLSATEWREFKEMLIFCQTNQPVPILAAPLPPVDMLLITDASSSGWGALAGPPGGHPRILAGRWTEVIHSSVTAEPEGAWRALQALQATAEPYKHVRLVCDHLPLVYAATKGKAKAWPYNSLLARLATLPFPVSVEFLPGARNPADAPSRQLPTTAQERAAFTGHQMVVPEPTTALSPIFMT
jgi:hypothetical protein